MSEFNIKKIELEDSSTHEVVYRSKNAAGKKGFIDFVGFVLKKYGENYLRNMDDAAEVLKKWDNDIISGLKKVIIKNEKEKKQP